MLMLLYKGVRDPAGLNCTITFCIQFVSIKHVLGTLFLLQSSTTSIQNVRDRVQHQGDANLGSFRIISVSAYCINRGNVYELGVHASLAVYMIQFML